MSLPSNPTPFHLLVVEDEKSFLETFVRRIRSRNPNVLIDIARTQSEALALVEGKVIRDRMAYDCAILDYMLPVQTLAESPCASDSMVKRIIEWQGARDIIQFTAYPDNHGLADLETWCRNQPEFRYAVISKYGDDEKSGVSQVLKRLTRIAEAKAWIPVVKKIKETTEHPAFDAVIGHGADRLAVRWTSGGLNLGDFLHQCGEAWSFLPLSVQRILEKRFAVSLHEDGRASLERKNTQPQSGSEVTE